jgi:hypothetical protein
MLPIGILDDRLLHKGFVEFDLNLPITAAVIHTRYIRQKLTNREKAMTSEITVYKIAW